MARFRFEVFRGVSRCCSFYGGTLVLVKHRNSLYDSPLLNFSQSSYHVKDNSELVGIIHRFNGFGVVTLAPGKGRDV